MKLVHSISFSVIDRKTTNIHSLDVTSGMGYSISCNVVYGNPFIQQSGTPYDHFELSVYADIAYPVWYNFNIQSDGYLFSYNVIDNAKSTASTELSLHYDRP
jgi:hypothetical protein